MNPNYKPVPLPGSLRPALPHSSYIVPLPGGRVVATVDLKPHVPPDALYTLVRFAQHHNLQIDATQVGTVQLSGSEKDIQDAFNVQFRGVARNGESFRARAGEISVPEEIAPYVRAVLGLDNRPIARPRFRGRAAAASRPHSLTSPQVGYAYHFPQDVTGKGSTIAIIELGGGFRPENAAMYFGALNLPVPNIRAVSVDGATNAPGDDADGEVELDIQVAGAIAPGADIAVYFAPNTDAGFVNAIKQASADKSTTVISISWGGAESQWTVQAMQAMNAAIEDAVQLGIPVFVAAGDDGASDAVSDGAPHVDFPASSPFAIGCGGTRLTLKADGSIDQQTIWNDSALGEGATGGGVSQQFALPDYQKAANVPAAKDGFQGRGCPDVSGNADPETGYRVVVDGEWQAIGGTSAVAPLYAGLIACLRDSLPVPGMLHPILYTRDVIWDVRKGSNAVDEAGGFSARKNWDACGGLGSIRGNALRTALKS